MRGGYREDAIKMDQMAQAIHAASINDEYAARSALGSRARFVSPLWRPTSPPFFSGATVQR